jgi:hypothetical protein
MPVRKSPPKPDTVEYRERRSQVRGLVLLAALAVAFAILRAGAGHVFTPGWWRLW